MTMVVIKNIGRIFSYVNVSFSNDKWMSLVVFFYAIFSTHCIAEVRTAYDPLPSLIVPPTQYSGFSILLDDEEILIEEDLIDVQDDITRVAFYHNGDRLHRQIPKQVHLMIENKLMGKFMSVSRFEIIDCIECRMTKVNFTTDQMQISQSAEDNQGLRKLAKDVRADAIVMWNASVHETKFTINLRMINTKNNEILWLKEYSKKTTRKEEDLEFQTTAFEVTVSAWGLASDRESVTAGVNTESLERVTAFGVRRRESTSLNKDIEYTLGVEYFKNFSKTDQFNVNGINLEGRVFANIEAVNKWVRTKAYIGIGQSFFSGAHSLMLKFGLEFPFVTNGFMSIGAVYLIPEEVEWTTDSDYVSKSTFGGSGLDLTLGYRF